jgi:hypothetical protein
LFATGVFDTGDKFDIGGKLATGINKASENYGKFAAGDVDTGGEFAASVVDAGVIDTLNCEYLRKLRSYYTLGLGGNCFMKKTKSKKSRDTVPLSKKLCNFKNSNLMQC